MRTPLSVYSRELRALYFRNCAERRADAIEIKGDQDSYPLQNPLHARKMVLNQLGRKERKPRQVKKQW